MDVDVAGDGSARIVRQVLDYIGEFETTWDLTSGQLTEGRTAPVSLVEDGLAPASDDPGYGRLLADAIAALEPPVAVHSEESWN